MTTHDGHGSFRGDSGSGASLVEYHGHSFAQKPAAQCLWRVARLDGLLVGSCISNQLCEFFLAQITNGHEMTGPGAGRGMEAPGAHLEQASYSRS